MKRGDLYRVRRPGHGDPRASRVFVVVSRQALIAFTVADGLWVAASAIVLLLFWTQLAPVARLLVIAAALLVEVFATLQFRAAIRVSGRSLETA